MQSAFDSHLSKSTTTRKPMLRSSLAGARRTVLVCREQARRTFRPLLGQLGGTAVRRNGPDPSAAPGRVGYSCTSVRDRRVRRVEPNRRFGRVGIAGTGGQCGTFVRRRRG